MRRIPVFKKRRAQPPAATGAQVITLDYPVDSTPRYGYGRPPHRRLYQRLERGRADYAALLEQFLTLTEHLCAIPRDETGRIERPCWRNGWLAGLDVVALYSLLALTNPKRYLEIGSGTSTRFARQAIREHALGTTVTSIDPHPRSEVDSLCDEVIRKPLERADLSIFGELTEGDVLFVDGSHRTLMNSDVTVAFLDILPDLQPGVLVEMHDIYLPWDYPPEWAQRFYSEQYLLAAYLLAPEQPFDVVLPNFFATIEPDLAGILQPLWSRLELTDFDTWGQSFWLRTR